MFEIIPVGEAVVKEALRSEFRNFEDAVQYHSAIADSRISAIIPRNVKDYKNAVIAVMTPEILL